MMFSVTSLDKPNALELRLATRPSHIEYLDSQVEAIIVGGPLLDADGKPCGSQLLIEAADEAAAAAFAAADPYAKAGLFASVSIKPFRMVFKDGARVG